MQGGVEITAYLVNESRARRPELARDPLARDWIPEAARDEVRELWTEFAGSVYPDDDLVVSLRGRYIVDTLAEVSRERPDTVLVVCGAGFTSYPWLLPFPAAVEADLPRIIDAKRRRCAELVSAGTIEDRDVTHLAVDLGSAPDRAELAARVRELAAGRPVAYVAEGLIFYLPPDAARAVAGLGAEMSADPVSVVSYWPDSERDNRVLAAQRGWFRRRQVPERASYHTVEELGKVMAGTVEDRGPEQLQRHYLGAVSVPEADLVPEHVAVAGR